MLRVLVRLDLNLPFHDGCVQDFSRLDCSIPVIRFLLNRGCAVTILSHFGRPSSVDSAFSLKFLLPFLEERLGVSVSFNRKASEAGEVSLLENVRFLEGEVCDDEKVASFLAEDADIFINDAFACCHRKHASVYGISKILPSYAGPRLEYELHSLNSLDFSETLLILGGAKVSTKIGILHSLLPHVKALLLGGGMANAFLKMSGCAIGSSFFEDIPLTSDVWAEYRHKIFLPVDYIVSEEGMNAKNFKVQTGNLLKNQAIYDIGPATVLKYSEMLMQAHTIVWNGPLGLCENPCFAHGTSWIAHAVQYVTQILGKTSVAGGGETLAAVAPFGNGFTFLSTGGGAFLKFLEHKTLIGLEFLSSWSDFLARSSVVD